jgi:adenylate cyclase class IV
MKYIIEIEKKFILTKKQEDALLKGAEFLGEKKFTDIYYDDEKFSLSTKDIWLRKRADKFELKVPVNEFSEDRVLDRYRELESESDILEYFGKKEGSIEDFLTKNKYEPFCNITTKRKKYKKDGFVIDVDIMDFGYALVEIELMIDDESKMEEASRSIVKFAEKHNIDINVKILGKVIEYLRVKNPKHLKALIDSGVVLL